MAKVMIEVSGELNESIILVQEQCSDQEFKEYRLAVARVMGEILLEVLNPIYKEHPDIMPDEMKQEFISEKEIEKLNLSSEDVEIIKQHLLSYVTNNWRKVDRVIGEAMMELKEKDAKWNGIPDIYPFCPSTTEDVSVWKTEGIEVSLLFLQHFQRFLADFSTTKQPTVYQRLNFKTFILL